MAYNLSGAQAASIAHAISLLTAGPAHDQPFDDTVLQEVANVAEAVNFRLPGFTVNVTAGRFKEMAKDAPITTLLQLLYWVGTVT
jgi:hypothetical protein